MRSVEFWFEFASTYSYLAALRVEALAHAAGVKLVYRPFLLGPIFAEQGYSDSPFNMYPLKGRYMWRDLERLCKGYGVAFRKPSAFPRNGLLAARIAVRALDEEWGPAFVRAVYEVNFVHDQDIARADVLAAVLRALGQEPGDWLRLAADGDTKARLRSQTEQAKALGIFGAPSFISGGELFWGNDRLEQALAWRGSH